MSYLSSIFSFPLLHIKQTNDLHPFSGTALSALCPSCFVVYTYYVMIKSFNSCSNALYFFLTLPTLLCVYSSFFAFPFWQFLPLSEVLNPLLFQNPACYLKWLSYYLYLTALVRAAVFFLQFLVHPNNQRCSPGVYQVPVTNTASSNTWIPNLAAGPELTDLMASSYSYMLWCSIFISCQDVF